MSTTERIQNEDRDTKALVQDCLVEIRDLAVEVQTLNVKNLEKEVRDRENNMKALIIYLITMLIWLMILRFT
jgi:hypothetical protein